MKLSEEYIGMRRYCCGYMLSEKYTITAEKLVEFLDLHAQSMKPTDEIVAEYFDEYFEGVVDEAK